MLATLYEPTSGNSAFSRKESRRFPPIYITTSFGENDEVKHWRGLNNRLNDFAKLPDNWAGEGSTAVSAIVISNARAFLHSIGDDYTLKLDEEGLTPTPHGTINLDWATENGSLSVEIGRTRMAFVAELLNQPPSIFNDLKIGGDASRHNRLIYKYLRELFHG
jgi:hypothetical protein